MICLYTTSTGIWRDVEFYVDFDLAYIGQFFHPDWKCVIGFGWDEVAQQVKTAPHIFRKYSKNYKTEREVDFRHIAAKWKEVYLAP